MWRTDPSKKEGLVELVSPTGLMVGYIFTDAIDNLLNTLNNHGETTDQQLDESRPDRFDLE